jgi:hypothetical protein
MFGILRIVTYKTTGKSLKKYLKDDDNKIMLFEDLVEADDFTTFSNECHGSDMENLKIYFKTVNYTTGMFTDRD